MTFRDAVFHDSPQVLLCRDKAVVDDKVDVGVVRVEKLDNVRGVRVVQEQA